MERNRKLRIVAGLGLVVGLAVVPLVPTVRLAASTAMYVYDNVDFSEDIGSDTRSVTGKYPAQGDVDNDGDVDSIDYGRFFECFSEPAKLHSGDCLHADVNGDGGFDLRDYAVFQ